MLNYLIGITCGLLIFTWLVQVSYKDWKTTIQTAAHNALLKDQFNNFLTIELVSCSWFTCVYKTTEWNAMQDVLTRHWKFEFDIFAKLRTRNEFKPGP